jgi:murein L,D-transpeptidase YcbB/YkuD
MYKLILLFAFISYNLAAQKAADSESSLWNTALTAYYGQKPASLDYTERELKEYIDSVFIDSWVQNVKNSEDPLRFLDILNPDFTEFTESLKYRFHPDYKRLNEFQNFFRWIQRFNAERFVLVNIASQELVFYENKLPVLRMPVIAGTRKNQTPTLATLADDVVVYPYWTATRSIAVNEILPKVKEDINYLKRNNFEVLDKNHRVIDPKAVDWKALNSDNFPYYFRQGTGCENSLGLLKINIRNPHYIYLHDTPHTKASQSLFNRQNRFFSHGCIRVQKPLELVQKLNPSKTIDQNLMDYCLVNQKPETISLTQPVPVFIMYFTDYIDEQGQWKTSDDYYRRKKK